MIDRFTAGATSLVVITAVLATRWAVSPTPARGRHRRAYGAAVPQQLVTCPTCGLTGATVHGTALLCGEGHTIGGGQ
jgi:hypothetical protein